MWRIVELRPLRLRTSHLRIRTAAAHSLLCTQVSGRWLPIAEAEAEAFERFEDGGLVYEPVVQHDPEHAGVGAVHLWPAAPTTVARRSVEILGQRLRVSVSSIDR